ncbi:MAG: hypothetical protein AAF264_11870, partial [Pseudomonadota bacterium]
MVEPGTTSEWAYRRDPTIRAPRSQVVLRDRDGIPYLAPEAVLLFKAKHCRPKDEADFAAALPSLDPARRRRLARWLDATHPGHPWRDRLRSNASLPKSSGRH